MGSGKSTIGPLLARRLGWKFEDLDDLIESKIGTSIATFFSREGEPVFRELEFTTLKETQSINNAVIALGGGALCTTKNLEWARSHGQVVYLEVNLTHLIGRLRKEKVKRPMLHDNKGNPLDDEAVSQRISTLLAERTPYYTQAHHIVNTDKKSIPAVVREIQHRLAV